MAKRYRIPRLFCTSCGQSTNVVGSLSLRGLCEECGVRNLSVAARQMWAREGEIYERWLAGSALALERDFELWKRRRDESPGADVAA